MIILRWLGGTGGDTVLKVCLQTDPHLLSNVTISDDEQFTNEGATIVDSDDRVSSLKSKQSNALLSQYPALEFLRKPTIDYDKVDLILEDLKQANNLKKCLLKTHSYDLDFSTYNVCDLGFSLTFLPFAVQCNFVKNKLADSVNFNLGGKIASILTRSDQATKENYLIYTTAFRYYDIYKKVKFKLFVDDIFYDSNKFAEELYCLGITFDVKNNHFVEWKSINQKYLPSKDYIKSIVDADYTLDSKNLTVFEKYCLLVISNKKFVNV